MSRAETTNITTSTLEVEGAAGELTEEKIEAATEGATTTVGGAMTTVEGPTGKGAGIISHVAENIGAEGQGGTTTAIVTSKTRESEVAPPNANVRRETERVGNRLSRSPTNKKSCI